MKRYEAFIAHSEQIGCFKRGVVVDFFTANEVRTRFEKFIEWLQLGPVRVRRRDRGLGGMVSAEDYQAMHLRRDRGGA